jgi:hypothetical protein
MALAWPRAQSVQFTLMLTELKKVLQQELNGVLKEFTYSRNCTVECMEKTLSAWIEDETQCLVPVSKLLFKPNLVLFVRICQRMMIMINHLTQVQVGFIPSHRGIIFKH